MLHSLGLDQRSLPALPVVGVNKMGEGNHGASKRRTPEGSAPPLKGSPLTRSAHQRRTPKDGEPGPDPWRGADHEGACGSGALCWAEESGTRRQKRTGLETASRNQICAHEGSSPGAWCWMPTELSEEVGVMAASAEDSQTRPRPGATQGRLCEWASPPLKNPVAPQGAHRGNSRSNRTEPPGCPASPAQQLA